MCKYDESDGPVQTVVLYQTPNNTYEFLLQVTDGDVVNNQSNIQYLGNAEIKLINATEADSVMHYCMVKANNETIQVLTKFNLTILSGRYDSDVGKIKYSYLFIYLHVVLNICIS